MSWQITHLASAPNTGIRTISITPGVGEGRQPEFLHDVVESWGAIDDLLGLGVCVLVRQVGGHLRQRGHLVIVIARPHVVPGKRRW